MLCDIPITYGAVSPWNQLCFVILVQMGKFVWLSPEPFPRWTWNLYHWTQQGLRFIKTCLSMVTSPITLGVVSPWSKLILCDHISWTLQLMDVELVPWEYKRKPYAFYHAPSYAPSKQMYHPFTYHAPFNNLVSCPDYFSGTRLQCTFHLHIYAMHTL